MPALLLVPVQVDALVLAQDQPVASPTADFRRLPYVDGDEDVGASMPYLGETILSLPFEQGNLWLGKGLHLHWTLPASLTRADGSGRFPAVPNRWLVILSGGGLSSPCGLLVESDYLGDEDPTAVDSAVSFPVLPGMATSSPRPYRLVGRKVPVATWTEPWPADTTDYLPGGQLTAVGYGEPTFAAFYPNCHGVFGLNHASLDVSAGVEVEVFGWYADPGLDPVAALVKSPPPARGSTTPAEALRAAIQDRLDWIVPAATDPTDLVGVVCHARLSITPQQPATTSTACALAVGNTGIEALSAHLAGQLSSSGATLPKRAAEDQLLGLLLSSQWTSRLVDRGAAFEQARHGKELTAVSGGSVWAVRPRHGSPAPASKQANATSVPPLPAPLADALNALNTLQAAYDRARDELASLRRQLFADFSRYLQASYPLDGLPDDFPDIDRLRFFIEQRSLRAVEAMRAAAGTLSILVPGEGSNQAVAVAAAGDGPLALSSRVAAAAGAVQQAVDAYNLGAAAATKGAFTPLALVPGPAPRYWAPNDPAMLLVGDAVKGGGRLGASGEVTCLAVAAPGPLVNETALLALQTNVAAAVGDTPPPICASPPWNPFLLEWEVEYFPAEGLRVPGSAGYDPQTISRQYVLAEGAVDLAGPGVRYRRGASLYRGRSLLTPHAVDHLITTIELYLVGAYCDATGTARPSAAGLMAFIEANEQALLDPARYVNEKQKAPAWLSQSFLATLIGAYRQITDPSFVALSQSLGGFHRALLMEKQLRQLPIADPLGFDDAQRFADRVKAAMGEEGGSENRTAPAPLDDFNPIRAGRMQVLRLRLVDTFGQTRDLTWDAVTFAETLATPGLVEQAVATLPPRLCQPSRLGLRFLSANHEHAVEMNSHPATSPICGFLVPNYLDGSVVIYDHAGRGLGSLDRSARWSSMPGSTSDQGIAAIKNPRLRRMVAWLQDKGASFLPGFLSTLDSALGNIQPEGVEQHLGLSLLMGRPLALVRASIRIELQGLPAIDQSWTSARLALKRGTPTTLGFGKVRFPVRLGEHALLGDGLAGYWIEDENGELGGDLYSPESDPSSGGFPSIVTPTPGVPLNLSLSPDDEPQLLSLLMDPRGALHATAGILPTKVLTIPPDQYAAALRAIDVTFLSAPVLTDVGKACISLPEEPGHRWSWLRMKGTTWTATPALAKPEAASAGDDSQPPTIHSFQPQATFSGPKALEDGWLALAPDPTEEQEPS